MPKLTHDVRTKIARVATFIAIWSHCEWVAGKGKQEAVVKKKHQCSVRCIPKNGHQKKIVSSLLKFFWDQWDQGYV